MRELREVGGLSGYWEGRGKEGEGKGQDIEIKSGLFISFISCVGSKDIA